VQVAREAAACSGGGVGRARGVRAGVRGVVGVRYGAGVRGARRSGSRYRQQAGKGRVRQSRQQQPLLGAVRER